MTVRAVAIAGTAIDVGGSGHIPEGEFTVGGAPLGAPMRDAVEKLLQAGGSPTSSARKNDEGRWRVRATRPRAP